MVLLLSESNVMELIDVKRSVDLIETVFKSHYNGETVMSPRTRLVVQGMLGDLRVMPAATLNPRVVGLKTISGKAGERKIGLSYFVILLFDSEEGHLISVMGGDSITRYRTGAASAVATRILTRKGTKTMGIFGAGNQAYTQAEAIASTVKLEEAIVYDSFPEKAESFSRSLSSGLDIPFRVARSANEVVTADIVVTATTSVKPILLSDMIKEGTHINAVGSNSPAKKEVDPLIFKRSKIVVDFKDQVVKEAGDLMEAINSGMIKESDIYAELGEILSGAKKGRISDNEITLFKSVGVAIEDMALAYDVYQRAQNKGIGKEVDFIQEKSMQ